MKGLILCNGLAPSVSLFRGHHKSAELFIAADGGGNSARQMGFLPDIVIGDLDSFKRQPGDDFEVIKDPDQETNDLEKALSLAAERSVTRAVVMGVTGQRIDQTLKNLSALKKFHDRFASLHFEDDYGRIFLLDSPYTEAFPVGTLISLFPLSGRVEGISTRGLKYALEDEALENGIRDGSSNRVVSSPVTIEHRTGDLLAFIGHKDKPEDF